MLLNPELRLKCYSSLNNEKPVLPGRKMVENREGEGLK